MAGDGSQPPSDSVASLRLHSQVQPLNGTREGPSSIDVKRTSPIANNVSGPLKTERLKRNDRRLITQELHKGNGSNRTRVLLKGVSGAQAFGRLQVSDRFIRAKHLPGLGDVQDGHTQVHQGSGSKRYVGHLVRPVRCLSSHPDERRNRGVPLLSGRKPSIHVPGSPIRTVDGAMGVHRGGEASKGMVIISPQNVISVPRRLVKPVPQKLSGEIPDPRIGSVVRKPRSTSKSGEIGTDPEAKVGISGRNTRSDKPDSVRNTGSTTHSLPKHFVGDRSQGSDIHQSRIPVGPANSHVPNGSPGPSPSALVTDSGDSCHPQGQESTVMDPDQRPTHALPPVVATIGAVVPGHAVSTQGAASDGLHGCLPEGLGNHLRGGLMERDVVSPSPHQLARVEGGADSTPSDEGEATRENSLLFSRQLDRGGLPEEARRHPLAGTTQTDVQNLEASRATEGNSGTETHRGPKQCVGRSGFTGGPNTPGGVDPDSPGMALATRDVTMGYPVVGAVRQSLESPPAPIRLAVPGRSSDDDRLPPKSMASRGSSIRVSPLVSDFTSPATSPEGKIVPFDSGSAVVPTGQVDSSPGATPGTSSDSLPGGPAATTAAPLGPRPGSPVTGQPTHDLYNAEWLTGQGFSQRVVDRIMGARALSTRQHYKSQWDLFAAWCVGRKCDPFNASLPLLTDFMVFLFHERGVSVRTVKNYRSAIAFYWRTQVGYNLPEDDKVIKDLFKSFKRERPIPHKHVAQWDLGLVLSFFSSGRFLDWQKLSDRDLTLKTVFLFALASGKRRSEIHAILRGVRWIKGEFAEVELIPSADFVSKTQLATDLGKLRPFTLRSLDELAGKEGEADKLLCPVRTLRYYLERSDEYRSPSQKKLFISYRRGMTKDITSFTISSYIKNAIMLAYTSNDKVVPSQIKAHSVRHVATSLQALKCYSVDDLLKAGAWSTPNVFISFYLQEFSVDSLTNLSHLGGFVAAGAKI